MRYLSVEDILQIHSFVVNETGGSHGVRDMAPVSSAAASPAQAVFGKELYPTIFAKAAVYIRIIIFSHPFIDGNKRTAMATAFVFLEDNGYRPTAREGEIERFALAIIEEKLDIEDIGAWLKSHSKLAKGKGK